MLHNVRFFKMGYLNKQFGRKGTQKIAIMQIFVHFFLKNVNYCYKNKKKKERGASQQRVPHKIHKNLTKTFRRCLCDKYPYLYSASPCAVFMLNVRSTIHGACAYKRVQRYTRRKPSPSTVRG